MKLTDSNKERVSADVQRQFFLPTLSAIEAGIVPRATGVQASTFHASRRLDPRRGGLTMSILGQKHGHRWQGYVTVAVIVVAATILVWMFVEVSARILTNWQTGRW
jgi:hypothetical protein